MRLAKRGCARDVLGVIRGLRRVTWTMDPNTAAGVAIWRVFQELSRGYSERDIRRTFHELIEADVILITAGVYNAKPKKTRGLTFEFSLWQEIRKIPRNFGSNPCWHLDERGRSVHRMRMMHKVYRDLKVYVIEDGLPARAAEVARITRAV